MRQKVDRVVLALIAGEIKGVVRLLELVVHDFAEILHAVGAPVRIVLEKCDEPCEGVVSHKAVAVEPLRVNDVHAHHAAAVDVAVVGDVTRDADGAALNVGVAGAADAAEILLVAVGLVKVGVHKSRVYNAVADHRVSVADDAADSEHPPVVHIEADRADDLAVLDHGLRSETRDAAQEAVAVVIVHQVDAEQANAGDRRIFRDREQPRKMRVVGLAVAVIGHARLLGHRRVVQVENVMTVAVERSGERDGRPLDAAQVNVSHQHVGARGIILHGEQILNRVDLHGGVGDFGVIRRSPVPKRKPCGYHKNKRQYDCESFHVCLPRRTVPNTRRTRVRKSAGLTAPQAI